MDKKTKQILMVAGGAFLVYMLFFRKKAEETVVVEPVDTGNGDADPASSGFSRAAGADCLDFFGSDQCGGSTIGSQLGGLANGGWGGQGECANGTVSLAQCRAGYYGPDGPTVANTGLTPSTYRRQRKERGTASRPNRGGSRMKMRR